MQLLRVKPRIRLFQATSVFGLCVQLAGAAIVPFTQSTNPVGIFSSSSNVETGTTVSTRLAPAVSGTNSFTHWTINGVRQSDASGRSRNPAFFTILEPVSAVAHYLPTSQDSDLDGLPDSYEIEFFGSLNRTPASDEDGDGFPVSAERGRGMSPVVANQLNEGGVSRRRGLKLLLVAPDEFTLTETSNPVGIISASRTVTAGTNVFLSTAPTVSGDLLFTGWYVDGSRIDSPLVPQPTPITVTADTTVEARYVGRSVDSDVDGIPDWYEWFHFGNLAQNGGSDSDNDGFILADELARSQSPHLSNEITEGGVCRRRGVTLTLSPVTFVNCTLTSEPIGLINEVISAVEGSEVVTQNLWGALIGGLRFVGWEVGGVRQVDPSGASAGSARFTAAEGIVATARFVSPTLDSDGDGVADWYELAYFGNLNPPGNSDSDGDGLDLVREERGGFSPRLFNRISEGGISRRRSAGMTGVNLQPFERLRHVLVDGVLTEWFTEDPSVSPPSGVDFGSAASPALCDWDGDGDLDLFIVGQGTVAVYENIGSRFRMDFTDRSANFSGLATLCAAIQQPRLAAGDWNLDGRDDLVLSDGLGQLYLIPSTHSFAGSGHGASSATFSPSTSGLNPALGDLDGDGLVDLVATNPEGLVECFFHSGNAAAPFDTASSGGIAGTVIDGVSSLTIADITLDGRNDVLASDRDGRIWEFHSRADDTFVLNSKVWGGSGAGFAPSPSIAAGDIEGDGDIDLIGGCPDGGLFALRDPKVGRPTGLTAASGASSVLLEWNPDWQSRIKGYHVYRSTDPGAAKTRINPATIEVPRYLDEDLQLAPTHFYQVTALTSAIYAGNSVPTLLESPPSATVAASVRRATLGLQDANGYPDSFVRVLLSIENSLGLAGDGMDLRIQYPAGLTPVTQIIPARKTVKASGLGKDLTFTTNEATATGELRIQGTGGSLDAGQGKLFTLTFHVDPAATVGASLALDFISAALFDPQGNSVPVTLGGAVVEVNARGNPNPPEDGGVEVGPFGLGDITGDGWVNRDDLDLLKDLLHPSANPPTVEQLTAGDVNGDGELSHRDLPGIVRISQGMEP